MQVEQQDQDGAVCSGLVRLGGASQSWGRVVWDGWLHESVDGHPTCLPWPCLFYLQVQEYKYEIERLQREMNDVKRKYYEQRRAQHMEAQAAAGAPGAAAAGAGPGAAAGRGAAPSVVAGAALPPLKQQQQGGAGEASGAGGAGELIGAVALPLSPAVASPAKTPSASPSKASLSSPARPSPATSLSLSVGTF